jgi:hypothetical protein
MQNLEGVIPKKYHHVLDTILPGGEKWHGDEKIDCLRSCPFNGRCNGYGPFDLCTDKWGNVGTKPIVFGVIRHVLKYLNHYSHGDLAKSDVAIAGEMLNALDFPFDESMSPTDTRAIISVRLRQAEFKQNLYDMWDGCSLADQEVERKYLIASHIQPWAKSSDKDRVDGFNGLLLPPNYDYLFDKHLITFSDDGKMMFHDDTLQGIQVLYDVLGINRNAKLRQPLQQEHIRFLAEHREEFENVGKELAPR